MWSTQRIEFNKDKPNCAKLCAFSPLLNGCWGFPASWKEDLDNTAKRSGNRMDQNHIHRWIAGHVCKDADVDHSKGSTNGLSGGTPLIYISLFVMLQKTLPEKATFWMVHGKWIIAESRRPKRNWRKPRKLRIARYEVGHVDHQTGPRKHDVHKLLTI